MLNKPSLGVERAERRGPEWQAHPLGCFGSAVRAYLSKIKTRRAGYSCARLILAFVLSCALSGATTVPAVDVPYVRFTDITRDAGITFVHENGAYGDKLLPETMGGGVAFFDYDNDGKPDLLFVNSSYWPGHLPAGKKPPVLALYHNEGKGKFKDVTAGSGLDISIYGMGAAIGDYDNDGLPDVFITAVGGNHLFHNEREWAGGLIIGAPARLGLTTTMTGCWIYLSAITSAGRPRSILRRLTSYRILAGPMGPPGIFKARFRTCFTTMEAAGSVM